MGVSLIREIEIFQRFLDNLLVKKNFKHANQLSHCVFLNSHRDYYIKIFKYHIQEISTLVKTLHCI